MDKEQFGKFIAEQRKLNNMTQGQLAEKVHVSTAAVSKWERCLCLPELTKLEDLAEVLDLSLIELIQCRKDETAGSTYKAEEVRDVLQSAVRLTESEMKKNRRRMLYLKLVLAAVIAAALCLWYLLFSRPMTLAQLYPMLALDECSQIRGYCGYGSQLDSVGFSLDRNDEEFWKLLMVFNEQEYRRSLKDLLPETTKVHRSEDENDFWWDVSLRFDGFTMPDGSTSSGFLGFHNWYGDLEIRFDGESYSCFVEDSGLFDAVMNIIVD